MVYQLYVRKINKERFFDAKKLQNYYRNTYKIKLEKLDELQASYPGNNARNKSFRISWPTNYLLIYQFCKNHR